MNPGQGLDDNDSILIFVALNGNSFHSKPTLVVTGDNNNTWGFDADSIIKIQADSFSLYSVPIGLSDTSNTAATAIILIPYSAVQVQVKIIMKNNQNKEVWNMDAITLSGVKRRALPLNVNFLNLEKTNLNKVKVSWSLRNDDACRYQYVQRSAIGSDFVDVYKVECAGDVKNEYMQFIDVNPYQGLNYYRIKSVYFNGEIGYTVIKSIDISSIARQYRLYPTIASEYISLINSKPNEEGELQLIHVNGILSPISLKPNIQMVYIGQLPSGVYKIICKTKQGLEVLSFLKI
jgi:hypothetical protein